jgi:hypothetical protein
MRDTRRFVETRFQDLSAVSNGEPRIAREEIAKRVRKITLRPMLRTYVARGIWDWLGVMGRAATMVVPGARHAPRVALSFRCRSQPRGEPLSKYD